MERFVNFLMNEFYESLENDLQRWTENLVEAVKENNEKNIETSMTWIKNYREMMSELNDENMEPKIFVRLLAEKYGLVRAD